ncbi:MAG: hypothetical protein KA436_02250 [Oligoflexales bacterium]|nr:hypothetical protein [Oligoflexales bacterium]
MKPIHIESKYRMSPRDQRNVLTTIKENRSVLLEKWNEFASRKCIIRRL